MPLTQHDRKMANKGYVYRLTPIDKSFEPVYAKNMANLCSLLRDTYPRTKFDILDMTKGKKVETTPCPN